MHSGRQQTVIQVFLSLPLICEFQVPDFRLVSSWLLWTIHMREDMWYLSFGVWFVSFNGISSKSFHFVTNEILFFYIAGQYFLVYMYCFYYPLIYLWATYSILDDCERCYNRLNRASILLINDYFSFEYVYQGID